MRNTLARPLTPSQLLNDMLDVYQQHRKQHKPYDEAWAMNVIREAQEEERLHSMTPEELAKESEELRRYGIAQSKKLGLKSKDIDRLLERHPKPQRKRESHSPSKLGANRASLDADLGIAS